MNFGWPEKPIGDVATAIDRYEQPKPGTTYRQVGVRLWGQGAYEREPIDGAATKYKTLNRTQAGDIIVNKIWARNGSVSTIEENASDCYVSGEFPLFKPKSGELDPSWFRWITKTRWFWHRCDEKSRGTSGKNRIRPEKFLSIKIPLPSLSEQRRIVAKIERLAAKVEEAKGLRETLNDRANSLRNSVIEKLLFNPTYEVVKFGDVLDSATNGIYKPSHFWGRGLPCVRMYNIEGPEMNTREIQYLEVTQEELKKFGCIEGDLVFNRVNSAELVGKTGLITAGFPQCTFESKNMRLRVDKSKAVPAYAALVLNSRPVKRYYREQLKQQCGMATLNQQHVRSIPFPLPSIHQQKAVVEEFEGLQAKVDHLKTLQAQTAAELDALLPSILDRAFKGEL